MNPFAQSVFSMTAPCLPCCEQPVPGCACALLLPIFSTPYVDYETAEAVLTSYAEACYFYGYKETPVGIASFDSFNADAITLTSFGYDARGFAVYDPSTEIYQPPALNIWTSVSLVDGDTLEIAFTAGASLPGPWYGDIHVYVYDCNGVELESFYAPEEDEPTPGPTSGTFNFTVPADGVYYIYVISGAGDYTTGATGSSYTEVDVEFTAPALAPNPVIALYDSGDPAAPWKLWACPKLLLPPLTESTGDWYADETEAQAVLDDPLQVSNCVGYCGSCPGITAFTATDGGTSLTLVVANTPACDTWGGVNCETGETMTITASATAGAVTVSVSIYDDAGALVEDSGGYVSSPFVSAALPYTGRYTVRVAVDSDAGAGTDVTGVITSSGVLSVNPVQALYDAGMTCPARLDCTP